MNNDDYDNKKVESSTNTKTSKLIKDLKISELDEIEQEHYNIGKPTRKIIRARIIHD